MPLTYFTALPQHQGEGLFICSAHSSTLTYELEVQMCPLSQLLLGDLGKRPACAVPVQVGFIVAAYQFNGFAKKKYSFDLLSEVSEMCLKFLKVVS